MSKAREILPSEYWSASKTADFLGVSARAVQHFVAQGKLPGIKVGHLLRIHPDDVRAFAKPVQVATSDHR